MLVPIHLQYSHYEYYSSFNKSAVVYYSLPQDGQIICSIQTSKAEPEPFTSSSSNHQNTNQIQATSISNELKLEFSTAFETIFKVH